MKKLNTVLLFFLLALLFSSYTQTQSTKAEIDPDEMMIRISEIQIDPIYLEEYLSILKEESEASVRLEPGVISIYPMYQKDNPTEIRILEIYADRKAYESHLQTAHFKHYKETTLKMVKSLKLIDMDAIDKATMSKIFKKL